MAPGRPPRDFSVEAGPPDVLQLTPLTCPTEPNFPLHHAYLEIVYAPLIGAGGILLARNLGRRLAVVDGGEISVDTVGLAQELGLRASHDEPLGKHSPLLHAIDRLEHDHIVRWLDHDRLGAFTDVPVLTDRALAKLPAAALAAHREFVSVSANEGARAARGAPD